jgi:epoxyqueuosine reductase
MSCPAACLWQKAVMCVLLEMMELKQRLKSEALRLGFADLRVAAALPAAHRELYESWVTEGKYGDMAWMARNVEKRGDPRLVVEGAQSVLMLAMNYYPGAEQPAQGYRIARYSWNLDYHDIIKPRLMELDTLMRELGGQQRCYVDTGPVLERDFAAESGLGWNGKSTMQIHRQLGTWFFLASIITTLELEPDKPQPNHCGSCTRCMVACPTGAITGPQRMDARRCVSYLTIEHKGSIPEELRPLLGDRIYGCDDCLSACPWNRFAQISQEAAFAARAEIFSHGLRDFLAMDDEAFHTVFRKSPIKRIKRPAFLRNVCVALGNVGTEEDLPALQTAALSAEPLIAEHALWAVEQIEKRRK